MESTKNNPLKDKSYAFALEIILITKQMNVNREFVLSKQLLKSGTSIGANVEEANQAESKADFIHKLSISNKEACETNYWLRLSRDSKTLDKFQSEKLISSCKEIERLLTSITHVTQNKKNGHGEQGAG
ncbi:MAG: four helix bundle protein [Bacteroidetes bacterium]|nr:four helix bundle protein [Bacteroidota bacterium]